jgi:anaphase-promoting complex subunit 10
MIQFNKMFRINELYIYLDFKTDESYTPSKISIKFENSFNELVDLKIIEFEEPAGWYKITLEERNVKGEIIK